MFTETWRPSPRRAWPPCLGREIKAEIIKAERKITTIGRIAHIPGLFDMWVWEWPGHFCPLLWWKKLSSVCVSVLPSVLMESIHSLHFSCGFWLSSLPADVWFTLCTSSSALYRNQTTSRFGKSCSVLWAHNFNDGNGIFS